MKKKDNETGDAQDFSGMPAPAAVTPAEIQQKEFSVSRFGGYRMRDVDEFLDQITSSMTKLSEENERLRSGAGLPAAPSIGSPDLADTSRQADEIIQRARAEAATIVQDARGQVAAGTVVAGAAVLGTDAGRAAVAPFLSQERDFLQQLATLVQSHAESVKGMAKANRTKSAAAAAATGKPAPASPELRVSQAPPAATQPITPVAPTPTQSSGRDASSPIRVEQPATASVSAGDSDDDTGPGEGGDRTLRELFWGEE
jgi:DivIVA domain-containing protein